MEQADCLHFIPRFLPRVQEQALNPERNQQKQIVAGKAGKTGAGNQQNGQKEKSGKNTGAGLLQEEMPQLNAKAACPGYRRGGGTD